MKNQEINSIIDRSKAALGSNLTSILLIGSCSIEEDFIEDWSDYDIAIIVEEKDKRIQKAVGKIGKELGLTDDFLISALTENQINSPGGLWPFNAKFRTKCIYGKNIIEQINLPSTRDSKARLVAFIKIQENQLFSKIANFNFWSNEKVKKEAYKLIKRLLFSYSIYFFLKNGIFLRSRREIYEQGSQATKQLAVLLFNWQRVEKAHIIEAIPFMSAVVKEIKEFCEQ